MRSLIIYCCLTLVTVVSLSGCMKKPTNEVVVFAALDREFSEPILTDVSQELGITVVPKFDQESNKAVGHVTEIELNKARPTCDVFWNNEIMHTMRLENQGLLEVYRSPEAEFYPSIFLSTKDQWHGFAARARVLIVNTDFLPDPAERPNSIYDLADPKWKGKCGIARPLFGTTSTHAAVLFAYLGEEKAKELLKQIAENAQVQGGNKQVAIKVARGELAFGLTDTDDAIIEIENANPVAIVFPDQAEDQMGTLLIPNTLAIIKNAPHPERAKRLVDRLLKSDIEERLAKGSSAQIPVSNSVEMKSRVEPKEGELKIMKADFSSAAEKWENAAVFLNETFPIGGK